MAAKPERIVLAVAGREVAVTNPSKVYFPEAGITKLEVVQYYLAVAEGALRGAGGRPNVLVRYANGIHGEFFYQKRAPESRPDWIEVAALQFPSGRTAEEVVPRDAAALAWMANLGCLELHPHPVRAEDLDHPDELRVDLDPVPGVEWAQLQEVARVVHATLTALGFTAWPKTSGSRGIHVNVRLHRRWSFTQVRRAALGAGARSRAARPHAGHQRMVEGGAARRLPRLQPERQGPHRLQRVLGAAQARRARLGTPDLGGVGRVPRRGLHAAHHARPLREDRRPPRGDRPSSLLPGAAAGAVGAPGGRGPGRRALAAALREAGGRAAARAAVEAQGRGEGHRPARADQAADRDRPREEEGGRPGGRRALEGAPSRDRRAPRAGGRAGRFHARPQHHLDARARQPRARAGGAAAAAGVARSRIPPVRRDGGHVAASAAGAEQVTSTKYDPFVRGRFPVGVRTIHALDTARGRLFPCEIWYPAAAHHAGQDIAPATQDVFTVPGGTTRRQMAVRDAAAQRGAYPLIVFSHHSGGPRRMATFLCTHLGSHGYVVAALDHSEAVAAELARRDGETDEQKRARLEAVIANRVPDVRFLLDHVLDGAAWDSEARLDATRIGIVGHSFGGWTALAATEVERRIRAVVALAPGGASQRKPGIIVATLAFTWGRDVPALYLVAEDDASLPLAGMYEIFERTPAMKRMVILRRADHMHFMDNVEEMHETVRSMHFTGDLAWLPKEMRPMAELCSGEQAHLFVRGLTLCHMDAVLRRQEEARRLWLGDIEAELAARGVDVSVHEP